MREYVATVTSKGQMTLPADVRRRLGIDPGDRVAIVLDDERRQAMLRPIEATVRSVRGSIPVPPHLASREQGDFGHLIEEAMDDHAEEFMRRMREGTK
jgi:AbrB family looped-hinge helix DNA binding protein